MDEDGTDADRAEEDEVLDDAVLETSLVIAAPPYLTTIVWPAKRWR